jgi:hypothetical protein
MPFPKVGSRSRAGRARRVMTAVDAAQFWQRRTNVWRRVTSPARGAERLRSGTPINGYRQGCAAAGGLQESERSARGCASARRCTSAPECLGEQT